MKPMLRITSVLAIAGSLLACGQEAPDTMVGTLERDRIELTVESNEPIVAIHVADGARVSQGDAILDQDRARSQAGLDHLAALHAQAAARLAELQRGPRQEAIREAQARLQAGEVLTRNARAEFERTQSVFEKGLSFQSDLDRARTNWEAAQATEQAQREALQSLLHGTTIEELQQAQAGLDAAQAQVREARVTLDRLSVTAPAAGVIDRVLYEIGERPAPGATVAVLLDGQRAFARIYVPEHLKAQVTPGAPLRIAVDGVAGEFDGEVTWVSADAAFTPYFALTEHDRSRLSYLAEVHFEGALELPIGLPLAARLPGGGD